jgi:hypothetical protein
MSVYLYRGGDRSKQRHCCLNAFNSVTNMEATTLLPAGEYFMSALGLFSLGDGSGFVSLPSIQPCSGME